MLNDVIEQRIKLSIVEHVGSTFYPAIEATIAALGQFHWTVKQLDIRERMVNCLHCPTSKGPMRVPQSLGSGNSCDAFKSIFLSLTVPVHLLSQPARTAYFRTLDDADHQQASTIEVNATITALTLLMVHRKPRLWSKCAVTKSTPPAD